MRVLLSLLLGPIALFSQSADPVFVFSTLAGQAGSSGTADGRGSAARFQSPTSLVIDSEGVLYVADAGNGTIRRISPDGVVSTIAGQPGEYGNRDNALGSFALFGRAFTSDLPGTVRAPMGLAIAANGTLHVADSRNALLRRVSTASPYSVTTEINFGSSVPSQFSLGQPPYNYPQGVVIAGDGTRYVADTSMHLIRTVATNGAISTLAGALIARNFPGLPTPVLAPESRDGTGTAAGFFGPQAICIDEGGVLYVAEAGAIRKISAGAVVTTLTGVLELFGTPGNPAATFADGPLDEARFSTTLPAIAVGADGALFVADSGHHRVRRIAGGRVQTVGGRGIGTADGAGVNAEFRTPSGLALDRQGNIYISDTGNHTVRKGLRVVAPVIVSQPLDQIVSSATASFAVTAQSAVPISYQWTRDGVAIAGATNATLTLSGPQASQAATYRVTLTNPAGSVTSHAASLVVRATPPVITSPPLAADVRGGQGFGLAVAVTGDGPFTYQWRRDSEPLPGATNATLEVNAADATHEGAYTVTVTSSGGSVTSAPANVSVDTSRIVNLSIRSRLSSAVPLLTVGFVVSGSGKSLLVRGVGPGLRQFGVEGVMADPRVGLFAGATLRAANDNWGTGPDAAVIAATASAVGAFPLPGTSADAALASNSIDSGGYSAQVSGTGDGLVLVELYDANPTVASRLVNVSARAQVGAGDDLLVAGFVVAGNRSKTLLIRAVGPTLTGFGVGGVLTDPRIDVFRAGASLPHAGNDNWGGAATLAATFAALGAFPFAVADSKDAAVVVTLAPGSYSAQVSGVGNTTGEALVEIYELP